MGSFKKEAKLMAYKLQFYNGGYRISSKMVKVLLSVHITQQDNWFVNKCLIWICSKRNNRKFLGNTTNPVMNNFVLSYPTPF